MDIISKSVKVGLVFVIFAMLYTLFNVWWAGTLDVYPLLVGVYLMTFISVMPYVSLKEHYFSSLPEFAEKYMETEQKNPQPELLEPLRGEETINDKDEIDEVDMGEGEEIEEEIIDDEEEEELLGGEEELEDVDEEEEIREMLEEEYRRYRQERPWLRMLEEETDENARELIACPYCRERYGIERIKEIVRRLYDFYNRFVEVVKKTNTVLLKFTEYLGDVGHLSYKPHRIVMWLADACIGVDDSPQLLPFVRDMLKNIVIKTLETLGFAEQEAEEVIVINMPDIPDRELSSEEKYGLCVNISIDVDRYLQHL